MRYVMDHKGKMYRKFFEEIASIPHESFNEKQLSDYIVNFAKERNLWYHQDEVFNVIVKKPASAGYEDHAPVIIQGHIDMVCVKTPDSHHDFAKDPLELYVEDGYLKAKNTTLGADCGHGISYMLSVLDDTSLKHPPIECLFTVQEEVGIGGPKYIDYSLLEGKRMIATDAMKEGSPEMSTTSVLGGNFIKKVNLTHIDVKEAYKITVGGIIGGHAAVDINKSRANAIKVLTRVAYSVLKGKQFVICNIRGGSLKNNIPNTAEMTFAVIDADKSFEAEAFNAIEKLNKDIKFEYRNSDKDIFVNVEKCTFEGDAITENDSKELLNWLVEIPSGTYMADPDNMSFPWTSRNLGTMVLEDGKIVVGYMFRSSLKSHIPMLFDEQRILCEIFNVEWEEEYSYPGYVIEGKPPMYKVYEAVYREITGKELIPQHIHAGTDVGTIMENIEGLDVIGIGPNTLDFHTPNEKLDLASYDRAYQYIIKVLERL